MIVAIHQPQYLPWTPYLAKANACDVFVYLDNVQYQKNGVQNRNQIKTPNGALYLSVPVNAPSSHTIREVRIAENRWKARHVRTIEQNYTRAAHGRLFAEVRPLIEQPWEYLADLNIAVTEWFLDYFGITCRRVRASEFNVSGTKEELVINLCKAVGGTTYLSGKGAQTYQDAANFERRGIDLRYHEYRNSPYAQCFPENGFVPDLSALDLVLNVGPESRATMIAGEIPVECAGGDSTFPLNA